MKETKYMPIGCVLFLFYYLCSEFLEIILKEMRGLAIIFRFFMLLVLLLPVVAQEAAGLIA